MNDPVDLVIKFLKDEYVGKGFIKTVMDGDPGALPQFDMPCLIVEKLEDESSNGATGLQEVRDSLVIKVVMDKREDFPDPQATQADTANLTGRRLRKFIEGRDPESRQRYAKGSLRRVVLNRFEAEGIATNSTMRVQYGVAERPDYQLTTEGHLTLTYTYLMQNPRDSLQSS
ncbi:hypothetical protein [Dietzia sp. MNB45]|uniref:hypothetical protein n=1 Tax=Dietzia sp. MNB45 TaxID=3238800 RepID=UPI003F80DA7F